MMKKKLTLIAVGIVAWFAVGIVSQLLLKLLSGLGLQSGGLTLILTLLSMVVPVVSVWWLWPAAEKPNGSEKATTRTDNMVAETVFHLDTNHGPIKITNPYRGILILGGAGAGKSKSIIEPILLQSIYKGFTGLLYDFKFPVLAGVVHKAHSAFPSSVRPYYVNFEDLSRPHRVNPLRPDLMPTQSHADEYARAILYNLKPDAIKKTDFWIDSAQSYLTALIWFLREEHPQYCTLPHVMALAFQPTADVVALLSTNIETRGTVASLRESVERKAEGQTAGVVSTLQTALRRINTKEIVWVLSGDNFNLNINDPNAPKFVTLGNSPNLSNTFGPVIALLATVAIKQMNQQRKQKSVVILDEAPTIYIPNFDQLPATGRSNYIATVFGAQDVSQIEDMYGKSKKDALLANLNNQFYGRVGHRETAQYVVDLWGKRDEIQINRSYSENKSGFRILTDSVSQSVSHNAVERNRVKIQEVLELKTGEFYGQLVESNFSSFKAQVKPYDVGTVAEIDSFKTVTLEEIKQNFSRIQTDITNMLNSPPRQDQRIDKTSLDF